MGSLIVDLLADSDSHWSHWEAGVLLSQSGKLCQQAILVMNVWRLDEQRLCLLMGIEVEHLFKLVDVDGRLLLLDFVVDLNSSKLRQVVLVDVQVSKLRLARYDDLVEEGHEAIVINEVHSETKSLQG